MAEYKRIYTHTHYWPTRRSQTIHPKAFRSSISGTLFLRLCNVSVVKLQCPTYTVYSDFLEID